LATQKGAAQTAKQQKDATVEAAYDAWQELLPVPTADELAQLLSDFEAAQTAYNTALTAAASLIAGFNKAELYLEVLNNIPTDQSAFYAALGVNSGDDAELLAFVTYINFSFSGSKPSAGNVWSSLRDNSNGSRTTAITAVTAAKTTAESALEVFELPAKEAAMNAAGQAYDNAAAAITAADAAEAAYMQAHDDAATAAQALAGIESQIAAKQEALDEVIKLTEQIHAALAAAAAKRAEADKLKAENDKLYDYTVVKDFGKSNGRDTVTAHINAKHTDFRALRLGDRALTENDFTVTQGSTVITLTKAFLETLPDGSHAFTAEFAKGNDTEKVDLQLTMDRAAVPKTGGVASAIVYTVLLSASVGGMLLMILRRRAAKAARL